MPAPQIVPINQPQVSFQATWKTATNNVNNNPVDLLIPAAGKQILLFSIFASGSFTSTQTSTFEFEFYYGGSNVNQIMWLELNVYHPSDTVNFLPFGILVGINNKITVVGSQVTLVSLNTTIYYQVV